MGVMATEPWSPINAKVVWSLCLLAAFANYGTLKSSISAWKTMKTSSVTARLFASPAEAAEWGRVTALVKDQRPAIFTWDGGAEVLFPWLRLPVGAFIVPGEAQDDEIESKLQQLRSAPAVIIPIFPEFGNPIASWPGPQFQSALDDTTLTFRGTSFEVYERHAAADATLGLGKRRSDASSQVTVPRR
jgi:hypothetical protein